MNELPKARPYHRNGHKPTTRRVGPREICIFCNAEICDDPPASRQIRRRWVAAIAALIGALVTVVVDGSALGRTITTIVRQVEP